MALSSSTLNKDEQAQEEARLTAEIDRMDTKIASIFADIGREYYEANPDDPMSEEMASNYREIDECKEQIQDLTDEMRRIKGITTCEQCGADISVKDTFCPVCGARIISEITVSPSGGICPSCGHRLEPGNMFCSTCGAKINVSESAFDDDILLEKTIILDPTPVGIAEAEEAEIEEEEIEVEEVTLEEMLIEEEQETEESAPAAGSETGGAPRFCMNCGAELEEGMLFCMNCGTKVEDNGSAASSNVTNKADANVTNSADANVTNSADAQPAAGNNAAEAPKFCMNCGAKLEPGDRFCLNCGQPVEE